MRSTEVSPTNPYRYGGPIRDPEWFFGRLEQMRTILDRIAKNECTALVGERRSGKTSLLFQLMNETARGEYSTVSGDDAVYL